MGDAIRANAGFVALFALGLLHLFKKVTFDWPVIVVFSIALLPQISRLIEYIKAGKDGVEMKTRSGYVSAEEIERQAKLKKQGVVSDFAREAEDAKKILKSLWHFQRDCYGLNSPTRWGFVVGSNSPAYPGFLAGSVALAIKGLIFKEPSGMLFLTNEGLEFCQRHAAELDAYPIYYKDFGNA